MEVVNKLIILVLAAFLAFLCGWAIGGLIGLALDDEGIGGVVGIVTAAIFFPRAVESVKSFWKGL